jgi:hypothetical protein
VESVHFTLRATLGKAEVMSWNVLEQDLWSLSDLFYAEGD